MNEQKKTIDMTPEELEQWLDTLEIEDTIPEYYFSNPDPYAKIESIPYEQRRHNFHFNADGHICVKNISSYWIPELTVTEEIKGTIYTVTGSYEGETDFISKLERIMAKKCAEKMEESQ